MGIEFVFLFVRKGTTFLGNIQIKLHFGVILLFRGVNQ